MAEHHQNHGVTTSATPEQYRDSRMMATTRPKIKIIHIIAPEIIKTDIANFRDLVQRLTGNGSPAGARSMAAAPQVQAEAKEITAKKRPPPAAERSDDFVARQEPSKKRKIKCEVKVEEAGGFDLDRADLWMDLQPGGFLSFLEDDNVFQGLLAADHDFLQVPLGPLRHLDLVGEMYAS